LLVVYTKSAGLEKGADDVDCYDYLSLEIIGHESSQSEVTMDNVLARKTTAANGRSRTPTSCIRQHSCRQDERVHLVVSLNSVEWFLVPTQSSLLGIIVRWNPHASFLGRARIV
jgi:hypothetical protein